MKKKIHWLCNDGSPLNVTMKSIWGDDGRFGVGGAELAMLTLCEGFHNGGYDVTLYNNPSEGGVGPFKQKTLDQFDPLEDRDYLVVFRSPNERINEACISFGRLLTARPASLPMAARCFGDI